MLLIAKDLQGVTVFPSEVVKGASCVCPFCGSKVHPRFKEGTPLFIHERHSIPCNIKTGLSEMIKDKAWSVINNGFFDLVIERKAPKGFFYCNAFKNALVKNVFLDDKGININGKNIRFTFSFEVGKKKQGEDYLKFDILKGLLNINGSITINNGIDLDKTLIRERMLYVRNHNNDKSSSFLEEMTGLNLPKTAFPETKKVVRLKYKGKHIDKFNLIKRNNDNSVTLATFTGDRVLWNLVENEWSETYQDELISVMLLEGREVFENGITNKKIEGLVIRSGFGFYWEKGLDLKGTIQSELLHKHAC